MLPNAFTMPIYITRCQSTFQNFDIDDDRTVRASPPHSQASEQHKSPAKRGVVLQLAVNKLLWRRKSCLKVVPYKTRLHSGIRRRIKLLLLLLLALSSALVNV